MLYVLGNTLALSRGFDFDLERFLFGYLIFGLAHLSVSFSNDYFDAESDVNGDRTPLSGGSGVLVERPELRTAALTFAVVLLISSMVAAVAFTLIFHYSAAFLAFAFTGALLGWFYSAPPVKLSRRNLGEGSTALAAGLVMPGMGYFVAVGVIDAWFLMLSAPLICYGLFFILTVEMLDVESDRIAGKLNTLVRLGRPAGFRISAAATVIGTALFVTLALSDALGDSVLTTGLAILSTVPLLGALSGLRVDAEDRERLITQVKVNFWTLMLFLALGNLVVFASVVG